MNEGAHLSIWFNKPCVRHCGYLPVRCQRYFHALSTDYFVSYIEYIRISLYECYAHTSSQHSTFLHSQPKLRVHLTLLHTPGVSRLIYLGMRPSIAVGLASTGVVGTGSHQIVNPAKSRTADGSTRVRRPELYSLRQLVEGQTF